MSISKAIRQQVHDKYGGRCGYCGCEISISTMQVDHIISKYNFPFVHPEGNVDCMHNLMPACSKCNHYKRAQGLDSTGNAVGFRQYMLSFHKRLGKLPKTTNVPATTRRIAYMNDIASKYGITKDKPFSGVFYFETLNQQP